MRLHPLAILLLVTVCGLAQTPRPEVEAHLSRGAKLMQEQLLDAAAEEFQKAMALDESDFRARFQYAVCLMGLGRNEESRTQFERVLRQAGGSPLLSYYLGRLDFLANDYASAIQRLGSVAKDPPFPDTAFYLGVAYISSGDAVNGAKWLEAAAKLAPRDYRIHYRLARVYSSAGREQEAQREYALYAQFRDEHKRTETQARACTDALRTQSTADARAVCHRMFDPNDPEKLTLLGQLLGEAGAHTQAIEPLGRATKVDPSSYEAWHNLGVSYFRLQRYAEARAPLEKAVALRPELYSSVVLLGATLYMLGDDAAALPVLERAIRLNPADTQTKAVLERLRSAPRKPAKP